MIELTIDGHIVQMPEGSMVMHAVEKLSQYVPHFCYHKKLSIAANCRMCLVDVEKAPKPLPACATPVTQGMVVHTASAKAKAAQEGVMEFLLINHPLDCPICDQGGECQLQDLAVGYGKSASRYQEDKRVVETKTAGALISMEEMSRCIHCTRCVRFGQEIAGVMELGMLHRGEHAEITTFLGKGIESELSGNMIDLCPVGALTSKPFRYQARTWELSRRKGISVHDSLGSNLTVQVKAGKVMRVLPLENEAINECWLSDRDRFAYEGLNSADRLTQPMIKRNGVWSEITWAEALPEALALLNKIDKNSAALAHAMSSLEELHGLKTLLATVGLNSQHLHVNLQATDAKLPAARLGIPWLGLPIAKISTLTSVFLIGSFLRNDQPLLAARLRRATQQGAQINILHVSDDDLLMPIHQKMIVKPSAMLESLAQVAAAVALIKGIVAPIAITVTPTAQAIAHSLCHAAPHTATIALGQWALNHPHATQLAAFAQFIATHTGAILGHWVQEANAVGAAALGLSALVPAPSSPLIGSTPLIQVVYNIEPNLDCVNPPQYAEHVLAFTAYRSAVESIATLMLPITPATEAGGTWINMVGQVQSMNPTVKPLGEAKAGWKLLSHLQQLLNLNNKNININNINNIETLEQAKTAALAAIGDIAIRFNNAVTTQIAQIMPAAKLQAMQLERVAVMPAYAGDVVVRRADSLQQTTQAQLSNAWVHPQTLQRLNLVAGQDLTITSSLGGVVLTVQIDTTVPIDCVNIALATQLTQVLGSDLRVIVGQ